MLQRVDRNEPVGPDPSNFSPAMRIMRRLNPRALAGFEDGKEIFIEDVPDPDGRWYRIEYRVNPDGHNAHAFCLYSPHGPQNFAVHESHLMSNNWICTDVQAHRDGGELEYTVLRARFWCTGYSFLVEHGIDATRAALAPDW